jgi:NAD kinase
MTLLTPRVVIVRRETDLDKVRATFASLASARFVLERKGLSIARIEEAHGDFVESLRKARAAIPPDWRQAVILRPEVERFAFGPDDIVVTFGQDGLVANVAKYLDGQTVIGVDPAPGANAGVLARFHLDEVGEALQAAAAHKIPVEPRVMAEARIDNGERLLALNEIFVGHRSHQSARYSLKAGELVERQSSSGLIVSTGTGLTGWASSILNATGRTLNLSPVVPRLGFLVREAWAGPNLGVALVAGHVEAEPLVVTSEMDDGGTIFADGVESDHLAFAWGQSVTIAPAERRLMLAAHART